MALVALLGSLSGAHAATLMPATLLDLIALAAMIAIGIYLWPNKTLGVFGILRFDCLAWIGATGADGLVIGFWSAPSDRASARC